MFVYLHQQTKTDIMKTKKSILNETPFKYKFADEDAKKSNERFRKLGNNAAKLDAFQSSLERGMKSC